MCQCEALARLPKLPYFLILLFLSLALYQPASACVYSTSCMSSLITFNHTYLKCIFIFTYIQYAGKPTAGRLRLGRHWNGKSTSSNLDIVDRPKKKKHLGLPPLSAKGLPRLGSQRVGQCRCPSKSCTVFTWVNRCKVMRRSALTDKISKNC